MLCDWPLRGGGCVGTISDYGLRGSTFIRGSKAEIRWRWYFMGKAGEEIHLIEEDLNKAEDDAAIDKD